MYFGDSFTGVNFKDLLTDLTWEQANVRIEPLNHIALIVFHVNYYVAGVLQVLKGGTLDISDKYSFDMDPITSAEEWDQLVHKALSEGEEFAALIEQMTDEQVRAPFDEPQYGTYFRNLVGMLEHTHYHLGQVSMLKKLITKDN